MPQGTSYCNADKITDFDVNHTRTSTTTYIAENEKNISLEYQENSFCDLSNRGAVKPPTDLYTDDHKVIESSEMFRSPYW